jgi:integration host factor subunit alpha
MTLAKGHLVKSVRESAELPKTAADRAVRSLFEIIKRALESGEDVMISRFGKFSVREKGARWGRNPQTGESLVLKSGRVVSFRCSQKLREKINGKGG